MTRTDIFAFLCLSLLLNSSCHYYRLERRLDPENKEWLNRVGYIISSEEKKLFLEIPRVGKEGFKREFWERRDPDPATEENEFKQMYEERLEQANVMFVGEVREGYLTDRGRIYILFGPPTDRVATPSNASRWPQEIWYYGNFPVVFVDEYASGIYRLLTFDLSPLRELDLSHRFDRGQSPAQPGGIGSQEFFNFDWDFSLEAEGPNRAAGRVKIEIPLANIWFSSQGGRMRTVLEVSLEIRSADDLMLWEHKQEFYLDMGEDELSARTEDRFRAVIPVVLKGSLESLTGQRAKVFAQVLNRTDKSRLRKVKTFKLEVKHPPVEKRQGVWIRSRASGIDGIPSPP